jgi:hypothetical protein
MCHQPLFKKNRHKPVICIPAPVPDWKDVTVVLCAGLVVLGAVALAASAQSFAMVQGKIVEKGVGVLKFGDKKRLTNTISVLIEGDDRVFDVKRGTVVKYPVSEHDAKELEIGSRVEMLVSSYSPKVRILTR